MAETRPPSSSPPDLQGLREALEDIDRRLLTLLRDRMARVEEVARSKIAAAFPFRDQRREDQVLQRVRGLAVELGLDAHAVERLYRWIMEMSISHQQAHLESLESVPLRVSYQGVEGSYSHLAAQQRYGGRDGGALLTGHKSFRLAATAVLEGAADFALLPIENSTAGSINETYDLLADGGLMINAEVVHEIKHSLLVLPGAEIDELHTVISHPQALQQCRSFFEAMPGIETRIEFDTAGAARIVRDSGDRGLAAVASPSAGQRYGLVALRDAIQDQRLNFTRFVEVAIEASPSPADADCKTSLIVKLAHDPSALGRVLMEFGDRGIQLLKLESRPAPDEPWNYRFYLDVHDHGASSAMQQCLRAIEPLTSEVRLLGSYPRANQS